MAKKNYNSGAYTNPMVVYNEQFDAYTKGLETFDQTLQQSLATIKLKNEEERRSQEALQDKQNTYQAEMYKKVTELPETGYGTFDHNKDLFFDEQVDKYFDIKNGMENGTISSKMGIKH